MYNPWFWLGMVYPYWYVDMFSLYPLMTLYWIYPRYWDWYLYLYLYSQPASGLRPLPSPSSNIRPLCLSLRGA